MALAAWVVAVAARLSAVAQTVAASAFLYGAGYAVVGVATGMRFYVWTISGAAIAAVLVVGELRSNRSRPGSPVTLLAAGIVIVPQAIGIGARLLG